MSGRGHPATPAPCPRCTGMGDAHYLTCPALRLPVPDEFDISEEQFEAAKAHLIARHGAIPQSLQRVVDLGGRFARVDPERTAR